jgi:hypothetical protein
MRFIMLHEVEVTKITLEVGTRVCVRVGKLVRDAGKEGFDLRGGFLGFRHTVVVLDFKDIFLII